MCDINVVDPAFDNIKMNFLKLFSKTTEIQILCPYNLGKTREGVSSKDSRFLSIYPLNIPYNHRIIKVGRDL